MKEQQEADDPWNPFLAFTEMAYSCLTTTDDDQLLPYEAKVLACGLCKLYFQADPDLYPKREPFEPLFMETLMQVSLRTANILYWQKLREDA